MSDFNPWAEVKEFNVDEQAQLRFYELRAAKLPELNPSAFAHIRQVSNAEYQKSSSIKMRKASHSKARKLSKVSFKRKQHAPKNQKSPANSLVETDSVKKFKLKN